jgi:hypothetical protein
LTGPLFFAAFAATAFTTGLLTAAFFLAGAALVDGLSPTRTLARNGLVGSVA